MGDDIDFESEIELNDIEEFRLHLLTDGNLKNDSRTRKKHQPGSVSYHGAMTVLDSSRSLFNQKIILSPAIMLHPDLFREAMDFSWKFDEFYNRMIREIRRTRLDVKRKKLGKTDKVKKPKKKKKPTKTPKVVDGNVIQFPKKFVRRDNEKS